MKIYVLMSVCCIIWYSVCVPKGLYVWVCLLYLLIPSLCSNGTLCMVCPSYLLILGLCSKGTLWINCLLHLLILGLCSNGTLWLVKYEYEMMFLFIPCSHVKKEGFLTVILSQSPEKSKVFLFHNCLLPRTILDLML